VAPALTARLAERLFLTPGRREPRPAERRVLSQGYQFRVPFEGGRLAAWSWGDGPTVFLLHGWGGSAARMTAFVDPLLRAGFSVVAFDGPGHGESDGRTSSVIQLAAALRAVTEWTAAADSARGHTGAIGHSIGGVAIALAGRQGTRFRRVVFVGSPSGLEAPSHEFMARLGLSAEVGARMQQNIERRFGMAWRDLAITPAVPDGGVPLLVVHDAGDAAVPVEESDRIAAAWPGAERLVTKGLGHHRILFDPEVVARSAAFISGATAPGTGRRDPRSPPASASARQLAAGRA
jgi:pimeloyl-ACP methyl ester carboxylesterase